MSNKNKVFLFVLALIFIVASICIVYYYIKQNELESSYTVYHEDTVVNDIEYYHVKNDVGDFLLLDIITDDNISSAKECCSQEVIDELVLRYISEDSLNMIYNIYTNIFGDVTSIELSDATIINFYGNYYTELFKVNGKNIRFVYDDKYMGITLNGSDIEYVDDVPEVESTETSTGYYTEAYDINGIDMSEVINAVVLCTDTCIISDEFDRLEYVVTEVSKLNYKLDANESGILKVYRQDDGTYWVYTSADGRTGKYWKDLAGLLKESYD